MSPTKSFHVVCAIIEHDGKFLAAKRSAGQSHGGFWEFPGGKIDPGEDAEKAIFREIKEELGTEISITKKLPSVTFNYPDKTVTLIPFVCEIAAGGFITPLEHDEVRWVDMDESKGLAWLPPDAEILNNYLKHKC
jgi:8-oxo-dGTP diphosphatase